MLLEMEKKLIAKGFQYSTSKSHKKEKSYAKKRALQKIELPRALHIFLRSCYQYRHLP